MSEDEPKSLSQVENELIVRPFAIELLRATRPVYLIPTDRPETALMAIGSGFFLRYLNRTFFLTASHVARESQQGQLFVPFINETLQAFGGRFFHTGDWSKPEADDRIDLAFIEVSPELAIQLPRDNYLTCEQWTLTDSPGPHAHYLLLGWPAKRNQPHRLRPYKLPRAPISFLDAARPTSDYQEYGIKPRTHYAVNFDRKRVLDDQRKVISPPALRGLSGGPCFFFHRYRAREDLLRLRTPQLVGLIIEQHRDAVVAVRLSILLRLITQQFDTPPGTAGP